MSEQADGYSLETILKGIGKQSERKHLQAMVKRSAVRQTL